MNQERLRELANAEEPRAGGQQPGLGGVLRPGDKDVTEILFIRHGQMPPTSDARVDEPLTEIGMEQADVLGRFLADNPVKAVYSSPMLRARQTADAVARYSGAEVQVLEDLREMEVYIPEGMTWDELRETDEYKAMTERFAKERVWRVYGKYRESGESMRSRVTRVVDDVVSKHAGERVALVTHGPIISSYLAVIADSPFDSFASSSVTGVTVVLAAEDRRRIMAVNSRAHFGAV